MNNILKMLENCAVEWKTLGEVCEFKNGFAFKSNLFKENGLPIIRITNVNGKNIDLCDVKYFNPTDYKENIKNYEVNYGDILVAMSGATTGKIGFYEHINTAYLNQRVGKFSPNKDLLNNRYLYHYLLSKVEQIYVLAGGGAQPNLSSNALMEKITIPIPHPNKPKESLEIQAEIVRILDTFTAYTAELTAELTARKKQYAYYRDQLLSEAELSKVGFEWKTLGEVIISLKTGLNPRKNFALNTPDADNYYVTVREIQNGKITFLDKTDKVNDSGLALINNRSNLDAGDILFSGTGTVGRMAVIEKKPKNWNIKEGVYAIKPDQSIVQSKYLAYLLNAQHIVKEYEQKIVGSPVVSLPMGELKKLKIPIPPLAEQVRIVAILDQFDALTSSLTEGLPREIELRQKQYEHYREQLLSFKNSPPAEGWQAQPDGVVS